MDVGGGNAATTTTAAGQHATTTTATSPSSPRLRSSSSPHNGEKRILEEHDSLVTVRLSEPPSLTVNTNVAVGGIVARRSLFANLRSPNSATSDRRPGDEIMSPELRTPNTPAKPTLQDELEGTNRQPVISDPKSPKTPKVRAAAESPEEGKVDDDDDDDDEEVNWEQLQKTEDAQSKDGNSKHSTAMLLARLEQENDKLATNPKSIKVKVVENLQQAARKPRPPSMAELRDMVNGPAPPALRYSMLPPPPMTDLQFFAALVKDYQQTAARLPTLLANKVRKGIPPPLRGVVWQSMAGARDSALEEKFERFCGESSPYEGLIGKDLGRSFPGVEMFREQDGEGQRMLGRVLKCYSLYDQKIGYCQGLAFLVGPLLMHMTDKQAFCVLVKLMENYDLRNSFTPDLFGLHVKIYQFRELLRLSLPALSGHLDDLQVDPAYVSQWFLSFFAVTCPLPMLFRIYDVIFAEGALETIMRVALSLMRKNQGRILACTEMEDVVQFLLSRGIWDCYHYNADDFVLDFVSLSNVVTRERLAALEQGYREAQLVASANTSAASTSANAARASEVSTAASRFLGRLWANSTSSSKTPTNLSPGLTARPLSMLRRSTSKQSIASTTNSMEAISSSTSSSASVLSSASTEATSVSRDSAADDCSTLTRESTPFGGPGAKAHGNGGHNVNPENKELHTQIEDLLTALSELQRQHALLADQLQREREGRDEDRKAVRTLLSGLRKKPSNETVTTANSGDSSETIKAPQQNHTISSSGPESTGGGGDDASNPDRFSELLDSVEERFAEQAERRSSIQQTRAQLQDELAHQKEKLTIEISKTQDANRRAVDLEQEISSLKEQLRESHAHVRNLHTDKQRLEKQIHDMRVRASTETAPAGGNDGWLSRSASVKSQSSGLRELKLGRSRSTPSGASTIFTKRTSSLLVTKSTVVPEREPPPPMPPSDQEALLLELVQAKTAEAVAKQECEETKQQLEHLRRAFGLAPGEMPPPATPAAAPAQHSAAATAAHTAMGMFRSFTSSPSPSIEVSAAKTEPAPAPAPAATSSSGGGFWGWRR